MDLNVTEVEVYRSVGAEILVLLSGLCDGVSYCHAVFR